jgi:hypothetical protein
MRREDPLSLCASDAHFIVCDPVTGEKFCGYCGVVLNDRIQYEIPLKRPWSLYVLRKIVRKPWSTILRLSKVEASLDALLKKRAEARA